METDEDVLVHKRCQVPTRLEGMETPLGLNALISAKSVPTRLEGMETNFPDGFVYKGIGVPTRLEGMETFHRGRECNTALSRPDLRGWKLLYDLVV